MPQNPAGYWSLYSDRERDGAGSLRHRSTSRRGRTTAGFLVTFLQVLEGGEKLNQSHQEEEEHPDLILVVWSPGITYLCVSLKMSSCIQGASGATQTFLFFFRVRLQGDETHSAPRTPLPKVLLTKPLSLPMRL